MIFVEKIEIWTYLLTCLSRAVEAILLQIRQNYHKNKFLENNSSFRKSDMSLFGVLDSITFKILNRGQAMKLYKIVKLDFVFCFDCSFLIRILCSCLGCSVVDLGGYYLFNSYFS